MKFDPEIMMDILYREVVRNRERIKQLETQAELLKYRDQQIPKTAVERLLHPEDMFTPTKNIRSEGEP